MINGRKNELVDKCKLQKGLNYIEITIKKELTTLEDMFSGCDSLENFDDLKYLDVSNVTNFSYMFYKCLSLSDI